MNPATAYHQLKNILAKTKLECAAKLAQLWDALKEPTLDQPKPEILLADWLDLCYQEYKKPNLLPNTQMSYERRIYQHIILKLGQIQPDKLNTTDIQEFYVSLKKDGSVNGIQEFLLRNLWVNLLSRPDFVAYRFEDREEEAFVKYRGAKFLWTIRNYKDMKKTEAIGAAAIFEKFDPKDYE